METQVPGHCLPESAVMWGVGAVASAYRKDSLDEKPDCGQLPTQIKGQERSGNSLILFH